MLKKGTPSSQHVERQVAVGAGQGSNVSAEGAERAPQEEAPSSLSCARGPCCWLIVTKALLHTHTLFFTHLSGEGMAQETHNLSSHIGKAVIYSKSLILCPQEAETTEFGLVDSPGNLSGAE